MKTKRVILLSNVCSIIPYNVIPNIFKQMGITTISPISFVKMRFTEARFIHILNFYRQVYIHQEDVNTTREAMMTLPIEFTFLLTI
ncbi:hypothetical protein WN48_03135 [Eufriesea mexicana]|nr:hypothetical protein WN48_03135 [Eufriesea mexicana]